MKRLLPLILLALFIGVALPMIPAAHATYPSLVLPITLTNSQSTPTAANLPIMLKFNANNYATYEKADLGNLRFASDLAFATPLYAWNENGSSKTNTNVIIWVNLGASTIAASGGTLTIYLGFQSTSTPYDGIYWGAYPTLTGTYAQYDNGASVFTKYDDFPGASLNGAWTNTGGASVTVTVNNGLTLSSTAGSWKGIYLTYNPGTTNVSMDAPIKLENLQYGGLGFNAGSTSCTAATQACYENRYQDGGAHPWKIEATSSSSTAGASVNNTTYLLTGNDLKTQRLDLGYKNLTACACGGHVDNKPTILAYGGKAFYQWFRLRLAPPNGINPTVSYGTASAPAVVSVSYTGYLPAYSGAFYSFPQFTYSYQGVSHTISLSQSPQTIGADNNSAWTVATPQLLDASYWAANMTTGLLQYTGSTLHVTINFVSGAAYTGNVPIQALEQGQAGGSTVYLIDSILGAGSFWVGVDIIIFVAALIRSDNMLLSIGLFDIGLIFVAAAYPQQVIEFGLVGLLASVVGVVYRLYSNRAQG